MISLVAYERGFDSVSDERRAGIDRRDWAGGDKPIEFFLGQVDGRLTALTESVEDLKKMFGTSLDEFRRGYVTKAEFDPVRKLVYGTVTVVLLAFIGGLAAVIWPTG